LPNSVRITTAAGVTYMEYLQVSGGGRYRAELDGAGAGDTLDFTTPAGDSTFDVIGPMPTFAGGESIVVYNLAATGATANAYVGENRGAWLYSPDTRAE